MTPTSSYSPFPGLSPGGSTDAKWRLPFLSDPALLSISYNYSIKKIDVRDRARLHTRLIRLPTRQRIFSLDLAGNVWSGRQRGKIIGTKTYTESSEPAIEMTSPKTLVASKGVFFGDAPDRAFSVGTMILFGRTRSPSSISLRQQHLRRADITKQRIPIPIHGLSNGLGGGRLFRRRHRTNPGSVFTFAEQQSKEINKIFYRNSHGVGNSGLDDRGFTNKRIRQHMHQRGKRPH
jgi:hypothetical protein